MKDWGIFIAVVGVGIVTIHAVSQVGSLIGKRLDEIDENLDEKLNTIQEKLEEIEANQDRKT